MSQQNQQTSRFWLIAVSTASDLVRIKKLLKANTHTLPKPHLKSALRRDLWSADFHFRLKYFV